MSRIVAPQSGASRGNGFDRTRNLRRAAGRRKHPSLPLRKESERLVVPSTDVALVPC